jgi:tetratricopeptide (TPR) repeat protein
LLESGLPDQALEFLEKSLHVRPDAKGTLLALASAQLKIGAIAKAGETIKRVMESGPSTTLALHPTARPSESAPTAVSGMAPSLIGLGKKLYRSNRLAEAESIFHAALAASPDNPEILTHLANVALAGNRLPEAIAVYERAFALRPDDPWIRYCLGLACLTAGDFRRGWEYFEARLDRQKLWREVSRRRWRGNGSDPPGKSMLLLAEQGLGDVIHFIRFVPTLVDMGYRVSVLVAPGLKPLLAVQPWLTAVYAKDDERPDFDEYCPLLSLPLILRHHTSEWRGRIPYLDVPPGPLDHARRRMASCGGIKVGFVWAGNPDHEKDAMRSLPLQTLSAIFPDGGVSLFSLQKRCFPTDRGAMARLPELHDLSGELCDFAATAALVSQLDLVVSVDTSVAHLAGALAVPVWILLPFAPDWRWQLDRSDSPWYPTARLYRQPAPGDWEPVIRQVGFDLAEFVGMKRNTP